MCDDFRLCDFRKEKSGGNALQTAGSNDHREIQAEAINQDPLTTASSKPRSRSPRGATKSVNAHDDEIYEICIDYFEINGLPGRLVARVINDY